jgi:Ca2+-binding RTX toxin-like protein
VLIGNSGHNLLDGKGGADTMIGGSGSDVYYVDDTGDLVIETLSYRDYWGATATTS